jgi:hypothetical protein
MSNEVLYPARLVVQRWQLPQQYDLQAEAQSNGKAGLEGS